MSKELVEKKLANRIPEQAKARLQWHRDQGHRLVLISATIAPMAEALAKELRMDAVYGCGPTQRTGIISGSENGWSVPRRKGKVPIMQQDAIENDHDLARCWAYGNTMADSWFMRECGFPIAINPEKKLKIFAKENNWKTQSWKVD
jgi:phosphoserine phosphatase